MRFIAIMAIVLMGHCVNAQTYTSRNNYTGNWEDAATWNYTWANPSATVNGKNLNIFGNVSLQDHLEISGTNCTLTVYDTLVVYGNLSLGNNVNLIVGSNGLLIVRGNLIVVNNTDIFTNGYVIITGDYINTSNVYDGSFWTTGNPSHVFIAGIVPDVDDASYPVLDCDNPVLDPFEHSGCAYGNSTDLMDDPIYLFFTSTCRVSISSGSNSPLCEGEKLQLTASGGSTYQWSGPSEFSSNLQNPEIQDVDSLAGGVYLVQISSPGCLNTDTLHIRVKKRPNISITLNSPVCEGQTIFLSASGSEEYQWTGPGAFNSTLTSPSIINARTYMEGHYLLKGTSDGCSDTVSAELKVNTIPDVTASVTTPVCEGLPVSFSATGATEYQWKGPGNFASNESNPLVMKANTGLTGAYVVTGSTSGCLNSDTVFLIVNPLPGLSVSVNDPFCEGDNIELKASGGMNFRWSGPSNFQSAYQNPVIYHATTAHSGDYMVRSFTPEGCGDSVCIAISVKSYPEAYAGEDIVLEDENQTVLQANDRGYETGSWSIVSGYGIFADDGSPVSLLSGLPEGSGIFKWTTANGNCQASDEVMVTVIPLFIPNVITPNSDGKNDNLVISARGENAELLIFNRMGVTVYSTANYANDWNGINAAGNELPDDTYFYVFKTAKGKIHKGSILIKRR